MRLASTIAFILGCTVPSAGTSAPGGATVEPLPTSSPRILTTHSIDPQPGFQPVAHGFSLSWLADPACFGSSVAIGRIGTSPDPVLMVGARNWNPGHGHVGGVFFLSFNPERQPVLLPFQLPGPVPQAQFGSQIATLPHREADGPDHLMTFADKMGVNWPYGAAWWLHLGTSSGISPDAAWAVGHGRTASRFGRHFAFAGDVNGDSFPDIVIGADRSNETRPNQGFSAAFHGSASGYSTRPDWTFIGPEREMRLGLAVNGVGDVNGDGFDDVMVGAPAFPGDLSAHGQALLFLGSPNGLAASPAWTTTGPEPRSWFGAEIVGAGDLNGDGFDDVLVSAPGPALARQRRPDWPGRVYVYAGSSTSLSAQPVAELEGRQPGESFGRVLCRIGDMDGDGRIEVAVGAPTATDTLDLQGAVHLFSIGRDFSVESRGILPGHTARESLGWSLIAGDLDQDGHPDLAAGAPFRKLTANNIGFGGVEILWGGSNAFLTTTTAIPPQAASSPASAPAASTASPPWIAGSIIGLGGIAGILWAWRSRRQFLRMRTSILADERERIARDLHDEVGSMAGNLSQIARLTRNHPDGSHPALADNLDSLVSTTEQLSDSLSEIVWLTAPTHDTLEDFACRLADHAVETAETNGFRCRLDIPASPLPLALTNELRRDLYLAAKEAIHNAVRHSSGTTLSVSIVVGPNQLSVAIQDDGKGLTSRQPTSKAGHGLENMKFRLQRHHGTCQWESANPGFRVLLTIPIDHLRRHKPS